MTTQEALDRARARFRKYSDIPETPEAVFRKAMSKPTAAIIRRKRLPKDSNLKSKLLPQRLQAL